MRTSFEDLGFDSPFIGSEVMKALNIHPDRVGLIPNDDARLKNLALILKKVPKAVPLLQTLMLKKNSSVDDVDYALHYASLLLQREEMKSHLSQMTNDLDAAGFNPDNLNKPDDLSMIEQELEKVGLLEKENTI